jgi:hypothetical protein
MRKTAEVHLDLNALAIEVLDTIDLRRLGEKGRQACRDVVTLELVSQGTLPNLIPSALVERQGDEVWHIILHELWISYLPEWCRLKERDLTTAERR